MCNFDAQPWLRVMALEQTLLNSGIKSFTYSELSLYLYNLAANTLHKYFFPN